MSPKIENIITALRLALAAFNNSNDTTSSLRLLINDVDIDELKETGIAD